ncbi:MAG: MFS transporter [Clostridia bacterium]|jgi:MFS family permease|nr:MFS transporter [Spirochaetia bacterium]
MITALTNRFLHWFTVGISTTVMVLLMLSKGGSVETIGLVVAIYSGFVIIFEFPSGVLSDIVGQKKIYLFSLGLSMLGYSIVLATSGLLWLLVGFSFYGIARAFSSGSVETIFINDYIRKHGKENLHKLMGVLNGGEILGLAGGALAGGFLPMLWAGTFPGQNRYNGNLILQLSVQTVLLLLTMLFVKEQIRTSDNDGAEKNTLETPSPTTSIPTSPTTPPTAFSTLLYHVRDSLGTVAGSRNLKLLISGTLVWGFCFNSIEVYWQPQLKAILGSDRQTWLFGLVNSGYFLASLAGVGIMTLALRKKRSYPGMMALLRIVIGLLIAVLAFQKNVPAFASVYLGLFMFNGMLNIPEGTLINTLIPDDKRSSLLSLSSLAMQVGGVSGSVLFSILLRYLDISGIWLITGTVFALSSLIYLGIKPDNETLTPSAKV